MAPLAAAKDWPEFLAWDKAIAGLIVLGLEEGFETDDFAIISEQDILGDRMVRRGRRNKKASDFISELSALAPGDLVVHVDHGIGRFEGLKTIEVQGAPHDCLFLIYAGGDRLFLPVENIELLSRYGSDEQGAQLDRLGGGAWQAKKAKLKERILKIAEDLIRTAAARELKPGDVLPPPDGAYRGILPPASPMRRPKTSSPPSTPSSTICRRAARWTGSSAATWASARPRWRCAPPSSPP